MDLGDLRLALAIRDIGSMAEAATTMRFARSTLSYRVKKLEREVGFVIFSRAGQELSVTPDGREFLQLAAAIVYLIDMFDHRRRCRPAA